MHEVGSTFWVPAGVHVVAFAKSEALHEFMPVTKPVVVSQPKSHYLNALSEQGEGFRFSYVHGHTSRNEWS